MKKVKKKNNFIRVGILIMVLAIIPISVFLVQKNQENRSQAALKDDDKCTSKGGSCNKVSKSIKRGAPCTTSNGKKGEIVFGLCSGGNDKRCCVPLSNATPVKKGTSGGGSGSSGDLKVATFNIGHANKTRKASAKSIAAEIKSHDFDVIGLQEADRSSSLTKKIVESSGMNDYFHTSTSAGNSILSNKNLTNNDYVRLTNCGNDSFRAVQKTILKVNNKNVSFYNAHIDFNSSCRKRQAEDIVDVIKKDSNPWILVGDFNFGLSGCDKSDDIFKGYGIVKGDGGTKCTDMIIYSKNKGIEKTSDKIYYTRGDLSDHNMISATFEVN